MNSHLHSNSHDSTWELLGELELPLNGGQDPDIHAWINRILEPLKLHEDLLRRVERSLQEAATRALNTPTARKTQHIHLRMYLPVEHTSTGKNWGFFRVEKIEEQSTDGDIPNHATELYLYLERH
jgi:hypothetical protein